MLHAPCFVSRVGSLVSVRTRGATGALTSHRRAAPVFVGPVAVAGNAMPLSRRWHPVNCPPSCQFHSRPFLEYEIMAWGTVVFACLHALRGATLLVMRALDSCSFLGLNPRFSRYLAAFGSLGRYLAAFGCLWRDPQVEALAAPFLGAPQRSCFGCGHRLLIPPSA